MTLLVTRPDSCEQHVKGWQRKSKQAEHPGVEHFAKAGGHIPPLRAWTADLATDLGLN